MKKTEKIFLPSSVGERHEARGRGADLGYWKVLTKILAFFSKFDEFRLYSIISDYKIPNSFFSERYGNGRPIVLSES